MREEDFKAQDINIRLDESLAKMAELEKTKPDDLAED